MGFLNPESILSSRALHRVSGCGLTRPGLPKCFIRARSKLEVFAEICQRYVFGMVLIPSRKSSTFKGT